MEYDPIAHIITLLFLFVYCITLNNAIATPDVYGSNASEIILCSFAAPCVATACIFLYIGDISGNGKRITATVVSCSTL